LPNISVASAAVPGILNGVVLMQKTPQGELKPMNFGSKFKDGSLRVDIPLESLHLLFNVNYSIVSQGMSYCPAMFLLHVADSQVLLYLSQPARTSYVAYPAFTCLHSSYHRHIVFFFAPRGSVGRPVEHRKGQGKSYRTIVKTQSAELQ
jgi:predicted acylesterase/phospholipase RssA